MTPQMLPVIFSGLGFVLALLGWAYQLGFMSARINRNEKDIEELKKSAAQNDKDFRSEMREGFGKVYTKIDELPCHNPGWKKDKCA